MENNQQLNWNDVPERWALCFNTQCPRRESCLRWQAGLLAPEDLAATRCVTPKALTPEGCRCFASTDRITIARGFENIFDDVRKADYTEMRKEMTELLSGNRYYYEYKHGKRPLSPQKQEQILQLFARWGYAENVRFDSYEEAFSFPYA